MVVSKHLTHFCYHIKLVFHQHLNSHVAYPGIAPENSNHTPEQYQHLPSYPLATQKILQLSKLITYSVAKFMHKFTNKKLPATYIHFLLPLRKFIHVILEIRQNQTNILFLFFIHYELNVQLNLEAQSLERRP